MDTLKAFVRGKMNRHKELMVFDWIKAVKLIKEHKATVASAGLRDDWEWTDGKIFENGKPVYEYTYLASTWAMPEIEINGIKYECYSMQSAKPTYDSATKWPEDALKLLNEKKPRKKS